MTEEGAYLSDNSEFSLDETEPFFIKIMSAGRNEFYNYDKKNNRRRVSHFTTEFEYFEYTYYPNSDLIMTAVDLNTKETMAYRYDDNGNMIEKGNTFTADGDVVIIAEEGKYFKYEYDLLNRLVAVYSYNYDTSLVEMIKSYKYNGNNLRVEAEDHRNNEIAYYSFDTGGKLIEKITDTSTRDYIYLGTRVLAHKEDDVTSYYATDHIGSTIALTDESGEILWTGSVTPFADSETVSNNSEHVMYTGKELDEDTGLYYYNARWYDPNLGRFTTEDPIRDGLNWYAYASNNPLNRIDPTGLEDTTTLDYRNYGIDDYSVSGSHRSSGSYNTGVTPFKFNKFAYALVEGVGALGGFTVSGTVNISQNEDSSYSAEITALGTAIGASSAGIVDFYGQVKIQNGDDTYKFPLTEPDEPYLTSENSQMIGETTISLPPEELEIDFDVSIEAGYLLTAPEGTYPSPVMTESLPVFEE